MITLLLLGNNFHLEPSIWGFLRFAFSDSQYKTHQLDNQVDVFKLNDVDGDDASR